MNGSLSGVYRWPEANAIRHERETYEDAWSLAHYSDFSPGERAYKWFAPKLALKPGATILDAGCGSGKAGVLLAAEGYQVTLSDITAAGLVPDAQSLPYRDHVLWHPLDTQYDYVYCCDVLEHIPTEWTMLALTSLLTATRFGLCLSIGLEPDRFGVFVGRALHHTVQPYTWWRDHLRQLGTVELSCDRISHALFYVTP